MERFTVTLTALLREGACVSGYNRLVRTLQGKPFTDKDEERNTHLRFSYKVPIKITTILESNGFQDALWSLCCVKDAERDLRLYAIWCANQVPALAPDPRSVIALRIATLYAEGKATYEELREASAGANSAAWDRLRERGGTCDAASAVARATAACPAWAIARSVALYSARAIAERAPSPDESAAAYYAAIDAQKEMLIKICNGHAPWQN